MPFNERDKAAARVVVHIFETGKKHGDPSALVVLPDGAGVSYGLAQSTHRSGSLARVVERYVALGGAQAAGLKEYVQALKNTTQVSVRALSNNATFKLRLKGAGADPLMRQAQEEVFDTGYMVPAIAALNGSGFVEPLSLAVAYDGHIQGGWGTIRNEVPPNLPEHEWITRYVDERHQWLANHRKVILHKTVYRTNAFKALIRDANWELTTPFVVRGITVTEEDLD